MKLAVVVPFSEQKGGAERAFLDLLQQTDFQQITWVVIFLNDGPLVEMVRAYPVTVIVLHSGRLRDLQLLVKSVFAIARIARQYQVDAVINWAMKAHLYASIGAWVARKPAIWYNHDLPQSSDRMQRLATLLPSRAVFNVTKFTQALQLQIPPHRSTYVVYPGVDIARFQLTAMTSPSALRTAHHLPTDAPIVGMVSRLQRWKGVHTLLQAMPAVLQQYPNARCLIVGGCHDLEPDYEPYLLDLSQQLGITDAVLMVGYQADIPMWMQMMDVVIHASDCEPFGLVVVEAMAMGKPVVAGTMGGPQEIITPDIDGLLSNYEDVEALAQCILQYLDDREFTQQIAQAAQRRSRDFDLEHYAHNFFATVRSVIAA
jgi:glycosyltransferase involved in cell wall biosynthesis